MFRKLSGSNDSYARTIGATFRDAGGAQLPVIAGRPINHSALPNSAGRGTLRVAPSIGSRPTTGRRATTSLPVPLSPVISTVALGRCERWSSTPPDRGPHRVVALTRG